MFFKNPTNIIIIVQLLQTTFGYSYLEEHYGKSVLKDCSLDTAGLIKKYNYPVETHYATTDDGYILRMHRIPNINAPPVFLMHGLQDSSSGWIIQGPQKALGYYLSDNGYDIWLGNARGNRYSRNHTILNPNNSKKFWSFSWHEIGYYDLPAMIDYLLDHTKYKKITYFGHSQGTTAFFVMASTRPEYNAKLTMMLALGPAAYMKNTKLPFRNLLDDLLAVGRGKIFEIHPNSDAVLSLCYRSQIFLDFCMGLMYQCLGGNRKQSNMTMMPVIMAHGLAGSSLKQLDHFSQSINSGHFRQFDYGTKGNMLKYGKKMPPDYPLEKITVPVGLYYAISDNLVSTIDVKLLAQRLPNVVDNCLYPDEEWNHVDMYWGIDARELAHKRMLNVMKRFPYD